MRFKTRPRAARRRERIEDDSLEDLFPEVWDFLARAIGAAGRGDAYEHRDALLELERRYPTSRLPGVYLWYVVRLEVRERLGRMPTAEDLRQVAENIHPRTAVIVTANCSVLESTLLTLFELPTDRKISGGEGVVLGSAIAGALAEPDEADLAAMAAKVARWLPRLVEQMGTSRLADT